MRLSDNDVMVAATLAAAVGETMTSKTAVDLVTVLEEIIDELTKRGGTGAMCAAAFKKHFPDQVHDHQHFPDQVVPEAGRTACPIAGQATANQGFRVVFSFSADVARRRRPQKRDPMIATERLPFRVFASATCHTKACSWRRRPPWGWPTYGGRL